jgi:hypothetical protein
MLAVPLELAVAVTDGVTLGDGFMLGDGNTLGDFIALGDGITLGDADTDGVTLGETVGDADADVDTLGDTDVDTLCVAKVDAEGVTLTPCVGETEGESDDVMLGDGDALGEVDGVAVRDGDVDGQRPGTIEMTRTWLLFTSETTMLPSPAEARVSSALNCASIPTPFALPSIPPPARVAMAPVVDEMEAISGRTVQPALSHVDGCDETYNRSPSPTATARMEPTLLATVVTAPVETTIARRLPQPSAT